MRLLTPPRIDTDQHGLLHRDLTEKLIAIFYDVYNELGHGFLEAVYEQALCVALAERNIFFERQLAVPVWFHARQIGEYRADLAVERKVLIELKVGREIDRSWEKQVMNYLRATEFEVGLLFNFGPEPQFRRYLFTNDRKKIRSNPCESEGTKK